MRRRTLSFDVEFETPSPPPSLSYPPPPPLVFPRVPNLLSPLPPRARPPFALPNFHAVLSPPSCRASVGWVGGFSGPGLVMFCLGFGVVTDSPLRMLLAVLLG